MRKYYREPAAYNSVFAGSYASPNAFGTSQIRKPLGESVAWRNIYE